MIATVGLLFVRMLCDYFTPRKQLEAGRFGRQRYRVPESSLKIMALDAARAYQRDLTAKKVSLRRRLAGWLSKTKKSKKYLRCSSQKSTRPVATVLRIC